MGKKIYKTIVFDCDGVLLDSNKIKTRAFYETALPFGKVYAQSLVDHHIKNGGISRNEKFTYFIENILDQQTNNIDISSLLKVYGTHVFQGLLECKICEGLQSLREKTSKMDWMVISGGNESEIRDIFKRRGIEDYFNKGIFGSPRSKEEIFKTLISEGILKEPAIYLGDSLYDHIVSTKFGLDFLFIAGWTEFHGYKDYCKENNIDILNKVSDLNFSI